MNGMPVYSLAIENALRNGYRVDYERGLIYGLKGAPLSIKLHGTQRYPTVPLVVVGMPRRYYVVPAHKVVAYAVWGRDAFMPGVQVRHGKFGVLDIRHSNLSLGTSSENQLDKPAAVRSRAARIARASQDGLNNAKLNADQVRALRTEHSALRRLHPKKFPSAVLTSLKAKYGISNTNIVDIVKGNTWKTT